jgi:probable phosphoglycerate mutase
LQRARRTAFVLAQEFGAPLAVVADLQEMAWGPWEGLTTDQIRERYPAELAIWESDPSKLELEGQEQLATVTERVVRAIERAAAASRYAACVTHLGAIRAATLHYTARPTREYGLIPARDCELVRLVWDATGGVSVEVRHPYS